MPSKKRLKKQNAESGKNLKAPDPPSGSTNDKTPVFCLNLISGDYCLSQCDAMQKAAFADTLHKLSTMKWSAINTAPRKGSGFEIITQHSLKCPLPAEVTKEVRVLAFRFCGVAPMLGYRDGEKFKVFALDRDFTAYDHGS